MNDIAVLDAEAILYLAEQLGITEEQVRENLKAAE